MIKHRKPINWAVLPPSQIVFLVQNVSHREQGRPEKVQFSEEPEWFVWVDGGFPIIDLESPGRPATGVDVQMSTIILYSLSNIVPLFSIPCQILYHYSLSNIVPLFSIPCQILYHFSL